MSAYDYDKMTDRDLEFFALGVWKILLALGDDGHCKTYDPLTVDRGDGYYHSYVFDLKDGGRHHPISDYTGHWEVARLIVEEAVEMIKNLRESEKESAK